jgi:hypothetical protein
MTDDTMLDMRTTLTLDDEAADIAAHYAESRNVTLGRAVSELIVRGARRAPRIKYVDGLPVLDVPPGKKRITSEHVRALEQEGW